MSIQNKVIDALKDQKLKLQKKVEKLEDQLLQIDQKSNNLDQYNRKNNLKIQGISANVADDELNGKVIDICSCLDIEVKGVDIEDFHRLGCVNR